MTEKLQKELAKFNKKELAVIKELIEKINNHDWSHLNNKKLVGSQTVFRVKKGRIRIIYAMVSNKIKICSIQRRTNKTYKDY